MRNLAHVLVSLPCLISMGSTLDIPVTPPSTISRGNIPTSGNFPITGNVPSALTGNTPSRITGSISRDLTNNVPSDVTNIIPSDLTNNIPSGVTNNIPSEIANNIPSEIANNIPSEIANNITGNIPSDLTGNIPSDLTGNIPSDLTGNIPGNIPSDLTGNIPSEITDNIPSNVTDGNSTDIVGVGPIAEDDALEQCKLALRLADRDGDKRIYKNEFDAAMVAISQYDPALVVVSLPLILAFNQNSCVIQVSCNPAFQKCCEGNEQYIDLTGSDEQAFLFRECASFIYFVNLLIFSESPSSVPTVTILPTSRPSAAPIGLPTKDPTIMPSFNPSFDPSSFPSSIPTDAPSSPPTKLHSLRPTQIPSSQPTEQPSAYPTGKPSVRPTTMPSVRPTVNPSAIPSVQPSLHPTGQPSLRPTAMPSDRPTFNPSAIPSVQPSLRPTKLPTSAPTPVPSKIPSVVPSATPTKSFSRLPSTYPSIHPSMSPSISMAPTRFGKFQLTLTYGVQTRGLNAEAIRTGDNNTVGADLIRAMTSIVIDILGQSVVGRMFSPREFNRAKFPRMSPFKKNVEDIFSISPNRHQRHSDDMGNRRLEEIPNLSPREQWRKLATYYNTSPVYHKTMFDDECPEVVEGRVCVVIKSVVTVFLDPTDTDDSIRKLLMDGFNKALVDGSFFAAIQN